MSAAPKSPGSQHLDELIRLTEIGYVRGIEAKLGELAGEQDNMNFVSSARSYVQSFDLAGLLTFLTSIRSDKEQVDG